MTEHKDDALVEQVDALVRQTHLTMTTTQVVKAILPLIRTADSARIAELEKRLSEIKLYAFHHLHCAHFRLENYEFGLRHMQCDCGFSEAQEAADATLRSNSNAG